MTTGTGAEVSTQPTDIRSRDEPGWADVIDENRNWINKEGAQRGACEAVWPDSL
ncbi:MAG: hypothetical protein F6K03_08040 [Kamptonema sp. SIO4C4]|nr:hypothetical protein [Kamptonema sp. SIO4C4]